MIVDFDGAALVLRRLGRLRDELDVARWVLRRARLSCAKLRYLNVTSVHTLKIVNGHQGLARLVSDRMAFISLHVR